MKPKILYYVLTGALVVGGAAGIFGYYLASTELAERSKAVKAELTSSALSDEQIDPLNTRRIQFKELSPLRAKLERALPREKKQSEVALQIQQLAAGSGMTVSNLSFLNSNGVPSSTSQAVKVKDYFAMPITFQLSGSYPQLQSFLQRLEVLERYTSVTSLAIDAGNTRSLTFTVNLNTFFKP